MSRAGVTVALTNYEMLNAATVGLRRHIASRARGMKNLRGIDAANAAELWYVDILGAMGELAFAKAAGLYWPASVSVSKDEPDIFPNFQVRTARNHGHNLIVRRDDPDCFNYALVTGSGLAERGLAEFIVHGYIAGADAKQPRFYEDRGGRGQPVYWIPPQQLTAIYPATVTPIAPVAQHPDPAVVRLYGNTHNAPSMPTARGSAAPAGERGGAVL